MSISIYLSVEGWNIFCSGSSKNKKGNFYQLKKVCILDLLVNAGMMNFKHAATSIMMNHGL